MRVAEKEYLEDKLDQIKFSSFAWTHDNLGVFYSAFDRVESEEGRKQASNKNQKVFFHRLGTDQKDDLRVYCTPEHPEWMFSPEVTDDGKKLILSVRESCEPKNLFFLAPLESFQGQTDFVWDFQKLIPVFEDEYSYITNEGSLYYIQTKEEFICIDLDAPQKENWRTLIPKGDDILQWLTCVDHDKVVACFLHDVQSVLKVFRLDNGELLNQISLPAIGNVSSISGKKDFPELFYSFTSFTFPGTVFSYDFTTLLSTVFYETKVAGFDPNRFTVEQVFYSSKDGTQVPMFLFYPKVSFSENFFVGGSFLKDFCP